MSKITTIVKQLTLYNDEVYIVFYRSGGYKVYRELPKELKDWWDADKAR